MKPIQTIITLLICVLFAACTETDGIETGTGTLPDGTPIELIIADLPTTGIEPGTGTLPGTPANAPANAKTAWKEGDKLYILTQFDTGLPSDRAIALRTGGQWIFSKNIIAPAGATIIHIEANYIGDAPVDAAITGTDVVYYYKSRIPLADVNGPLLLDEFRHRYAYVTFTGLAEGNVVTFPGRYGMLTTGYQHGLTTRAPTATVPPGETSVSGYTYIFSNETYPFAITRGGITTTYQHNSRISNGRSYTIDCTGLAPGGVGMDDESYWESLKERDRFLAWARNEIDNHINAPFTLACDIDLTGYEWTPVGTDANRYTGTFDGGGHTITGLTVNLTETDARAALFAYIGAGGTVKNLHLRGASVTSTNGWAGGIASLNPGIITGCTVQGTVTGKAVVGGIVAANGNTITGCTFHGDVRATAGNAGGIVGNNSNARSIVAGCIMQGTVTGRDYTGGIVGYHLNSATVAGCYSLATAVTRTVDANTGGIVGGNASTITACYWLSGKDLPTKPIGSGTKPAEDSTGSFATAAQFTGSMVDAMNTAMRNAGITTHTWTKANATTYPEINTVTNP